MQSSLNTMLEACDSVSKEECGVRSKRVSDASTVCHKLDMSELRDSE